MDFIFYLSCFFLIGIFGALDNCIDYDFWARLVVGKSFFQTGELFHNDFQSYGSTGEFIDHEWGSSLIFYLIQDKFGDVGLYIFKVTVIFFVFFIIAKIIRIEKSDAKFHFLFFFFAVQSIVYNNFSTIRCQIFSFFFFVLYLYILKKVQKELNYRILCCLPVLNIIWLNLHGGFVLGLFLIFAYIIGEYLNKRNFKPYLVVFVVCLFTILVNPYGIKYIDFIIHALFLKRTFIIEWQSPFLNILKFSLLKYKLFLFLTLSLFLFSIIRDIKKSGFKQFYINIDKTKYLIILFVLLISIKSLRFHIFYTYSVIALCYNDFYNIFSKKLPEIIDNTKEIILCSLLFISFLSHLYNYKFTNTVLNKIYPVEAVKFLEINDIKGNILTNFHLGSYVSYKLYPNNFIYMDGRYEEVYDVNLINDMALMFKSEKYEEIFGKYHHDIVLIDRIYPLYSYLKNNSKWFLVYEDKYFALFLSSSYKNSKFKLPSYDSKYYNSTKFQTKINWL